MHIAKTTISQTTVSVDQAMGISPMTEPSLRAEMAELGITMRSLYRQADKRTGPTVDAISLRAGCVADGWRPHTAAAMACECQRAPSREAEAAAGTWLRLPYSRSAFERMLHQVGALYQHGGLSPQGKYPQRKTKLYSCAVLD